MRKKGRIREDYSVEMRRLWRMQKGENETEDRLRQRSDRKETAREEKEK